MPFQDLEVLPPFALDHRPREGELQPRRNFPILSRIRMKNRQ